MARFLDVEIALDRAVQFIGDLLKNGLAVESAVGLLDHSLSLAVLGPITARHDAPSTPGSGCASDLEH